MKKCKITVMKMASYPDLSEKFENPIDCPCEMVEGQVFLSDKGEKPEGMCDSAWETLAPFVSELARGGGDFYDGWMKNRHAAMVSCNDGFRPVSFYVEVME